MMVRVAKEICDGMSQQRSRDEFFVSALYNILLYVDHASREITTVSALHRKVGRGREFIIATHIISVAVCPSHTEVGKSAKLELFFL